MTVLAYEPSGHNAELGRPINPRGREHICGGSSSGSAVRGGGGDGGSRDWHGYGGSVRIPAHCSGVASWKPTNGLIDKSGVMPLAETLDTVGFLTRGVAPLARLACHFGAAKQGPFAALHIAGDALAASAPAIRAVTEACAAKAGLPARDVAALPLLHACDTPVLTLLQGEAYRAHRGRIEAGLLDPTLAARLAKARPSAMTRWKPRGRNSRPSPWLSSTP